MNLYRNSDGTWVGTKAEAEKGAEKVDVPINPKSDLIVFLNSLNTPAVSQPDSATTPPDTRMTIEEQVRGAPLRRRLRWAVEAIDASEEMMVKMSQALRAQRDTK